MAVERDAGAARPESLIYFRRYSDLPEFQPLGPHDGDPFDVTSYRTISIGEFKAGLTSAGEAEDAGIPDEEVNEGEDTPENPQEEA